MNRGHSCRKGRDVTWWDCIVSDCRNCAEQSRFGTASCLIFALLFSRLLFYVYGPRPICM